MRTPRWQLTAECLILLGSDGNQSVYNQGVISIGPGTNDSLTFRGDGTPAGQFSLGNDGAINITNGTLVLDSNGGAGSNFSIGAVSASGTLTLSGGTITGTSGTEIFTNGPGNTLQGNGTVAPSVSFANLGNVVASGGTLILGNSSDYSSGTLSGAGTFTANSNAILQFGNMTAGTGIATNAADIVLNGTGQFQNAHGDDALSSFLTTNNGTLTLQMAPTLALTTAFTNNGILNVAATSASILTHGTFANMVAGSLNGGTYNLGGTLLYNGADITAIGATTALTLDGSGSIVNTSGGDHNSLTGSLTANNGVLALQDGADLALTTVFTNNGSLNVGTTATFDMTGGTLTNVAGGVLNGGVYDIGGTLLYNGADITSIGATANLALDGSGGIVNANGGNHNALAGSLSTNNGTFTLQNGANFALSTVFTNGGSLNVLATATLDLTGGTFTNAAGGILNGGEYTIGGTLLYHGSDITAIGATASLTLDGSGVMLNSSGGNHDALAGSLTANNGILTLQNGASLTLSQSFTNSGSLNVLANSTLNATNGFTNVDSHGVLSGGAYTIGGTLNYSGADITAIGRTASLTLDGAGSIVNTAGSNPDALSYSLAKNYGTLTLQNGADLVLNQTFTNHGSLNILANSTLDLTNPGANFGNVDGNGVLKGGAYTIGGYVLYNGADIATLGAHTNFTLDGAGAIVNESTGDLVSNTLATNYGTLKLQSGANVELGAAFTNNGSVDLASGTSFTVDTGDYTQTGVSTQVDGLLTAAEIDVQGGTLNGAGTIAGSLVNEGGTVRAGGWRARSSDCGRFHPDSRGRPPVRHSVE